MSYTLVVIDMQPKFGPNKRVIFNTKQLVKKAIEDKASIIFIEYVDKIEYNSVSNKTLKGLIKLTKEAFVVYKDHPNGSCQVDKCISDNNLPKQLVVCGVNTDVCVFETVEGLHKLNKYNISVIEKACGAKSLFEYTSLKMHQSGIVEMTNLGVNVIYD